MAYAKPLLSVCLVMLLFGVAPRPAAAHPLGNFTVNHYSRVTVRGDAIQIRYVLDLAEIPSVQEMRSADVDGKGTVTAAEWEAYKQRKVEEIGRQIEMSVDGHPLELRPTEVNLSQPLGQGDIPLVRLEMWFEALTSGMATDVQHHATFRDRGDPARIGWREIVVQSGSGALVANSSVPDVDVSDELRSYPDNLLQTPLDRREAEWTFRLGLPTGSVTVARPGTVGSRPTDAFAALVTAADLNPAVVLLALAGAALLGGIHAASPGHGKSIMAAYIVGTRGTVSHALVLALSVTVAHTTGVLVLGLATVVASNLIFPEQLYPWLTLISGALVLVVGLGFLAQSVRHRGRVDDRHHHHGHTHSHSHPVGEESARYEHGHSGAAVHAALAPTWRNLFALGLAGGIVPSGSALVVLLSSVALGRLGFGLVLIVAFGLGMAVVLVATGVLLVHAGRFMLRLFPDDDSSPKRQWLMAAVPVVSACIMTVLGIVATFEGLSQLGMVRF
jgi:ABC-type nickel/cobalt efflux system permease component RcnA